MKTLAELKEEFADRFTLAGVGGDFLDETSTGDEVWEWILEHFELKNDCCWDRGCRHLTGGCSCACHGG